MSEEHEPTLTPPSTAASEWDAGFEGDRWIVVSKLGPFIRLFKRPPDFSKRFYHRLYQLKVEDWSIHSTVKLLSGFCLMNARLSIRFQATLNYAMRNQEVLATLAEHIKSHYEILIKDVVDQQLVSAENSEWIYEGLEDIEVMVATSVNETLAAQDIQCRTRCELEPCFAALPDDDGQTAANHFRHERTYLEFMRRNHEFRDRRNQELYRQSIDDEKAKLEYKKRLLQQTREDEQLDHQQAVEASELLKAKLHQEEERQFASQQSEERIAAMKLEHQHRLKQLELENEIKNKKKRYQATNEISQYLRREIELLVLEKQRKMLELDIQKAAAKTTPETGAATKAPSGNKTVDTSRNQ